MTTKRSIKTPYVANDNSSGEVAHHEHHEHHDSPTANDHRQRDWSKLREDANLATENEHNTTFLQAVKLYPKAVAWSLVVSLAIIMDGYDTALMGSLFGFPAFQRKYGHQVPDSNKYTLTAQWQMALGMATPVGNVVGIILNGHLTDKFGHKPVLHGGLIALIGLIFIQFFAQNVQVLFVGQLLCGIPWGMFTTLAPAFSSEIAPLILRSYLETWVVCCWGIGQFFSYAVLFSLNDWDSQWAYRIPFAIQWLWPIIILLLAIFCPESPWWLVRKGRYEMAKQSVIRLSSAKSKEIAVENAKKAVALMIETDKLEKETTKDTSFLACFKGHDLWRTEIACFTWGSQIFTGFVVQSYAAYFFQQAGLSPSDSFKMTLGMGGIHLLCNLASAALTGNYGRRPLYLWGNLALALIIMVVGFLAFGPLNSAFGYATSAVYLVWFAVWCLTMGPLPYVINAEVSSTRLRSKTIALARGTYLILNIINSVVSPYILNPQNANWRGKSGLLTSGLTVVSLIWAYFRLPETGNRTFEELDILFAEKNITARKFSKAVIYREGEVVRVTGPHTSDS
ncbi:unnamed protein product [Clonostachys byssicola]|uniref:Major facilitator superfamily (MFS) profile domain-containing protein n=1 Tax=Clonostachys byssicola TaxID=160290 RepID=A0A9N9TZZ6_9HYPO|nr:unnamed protein product [Clonostachys byssicola]